MVKIINDARSSVGKGTKYAALTYCWGPPSTKKIKYLNLTAQDLKEMAEGIPIDDDLPLVFQDAVQTARALKMRYLWIDALCIAQGDQEEWKTESLAMREVYAGAHVTISANAAPTCHDSFLKMPGRRGRAGFDICKGRSYFGSRIMARFPDDGTLGENDIYRLHSRGWTLQELLLSTRVISFLFDQAYFSCAENHLSREDGYLTSWNPCDYPQQTTTLRKWWSQLVSAPKIRSRMVPDEELLDLWRDLVEEYTTRDLSNLDDRLPAISGLAAQLKQQFSPRMTEYCAGLWTKDFVNGLCWFRDGNEIWTPPTKSPSWSWVSCPGEVDYEVYSDSQPLARLATINRLSEQKEFKNIDAPEHDDELPALDPSLVSSEFGHVESAEATIEGRMFEVDLRFQKNGEAYVQEGCIRGLSKRECQLSFYMDRQAGSDETSGPSIRRSMREDYPDDFWDHGGTVLLLALSEHGLPLRTLLVRHLILVRSTTKSDKYLRVGLCEANLNWDFLPDIPKSYHGGVFDSWMAHFKLGCITII
ncbi:uncharacterized protein PV07_12161 [Cladophialophora immunda]|uniref:Heterokaryon incompatibility domain-containing protein n=1 Tax=Cladophialophora immunda TaxID=569365 RepID=A0A0D2ABU1_9EURO|nr:uncharacterized protein PV07_12161 [Cladophialophora immunda]KIW22257.1 hypothetical protein PV07_12161 [Cladophialophora immunda]